MPRFLNVLLLLLVCLPPAAPAQHRKRPAPPLPAPVPMSAALPNPEQLIARARATAKATFAERENYLCQVHIEQDDLDSNGNVKSKHTRDEESFFVNGHMISRMLTKDGKTLSPNEYQKEDVRVQKEVKKYSDPSEAEQSESATQQQLQSALRMLNFTNERRELANGKPTIVFDVAGNMNAKPDGLTDRFMQAMQGVIRFDEQSGHIMDLNVRSTRDVKIAGGLLATVHKNSVLHLQFSQQKDGVWLLHSIEAQGDGRAALFMHPSIRFRQNEGDCHLYSVSSQETGQAVAGAKK